MDKHAHKVFEMLRNIAQFLQISTVFCIMMLILYWIQNLTGNAWGWTGFINPFLKFFVDIGKAIYDGSVTLFAALFEFKYLLAIMIFVAIYHIFRLMYMGIEFLEEAYDAGRIFAKKIEQDNLNNKLMSQQEQEQVQIKRFRIFVAISPQTNTIAQLEPVDINEQAKIMNKFLIDKTGISPKFYKDGFIYNFANFNNIDEILDIFFTVLRSDAPVNYIICVQIVECGNQRDDKELDNLISLKLMNKISTFSSVAWRYGFNKETKYKIIQLGLFQHGKSVFEVHEFSGLKEDFLIADNP